MTPIDEIGKWSKKKLDLLRAYLIEYTKILSNQDWATYYYIDAFAGSGRPRLKDEKQFVDGSPRIALSLEKPFSGYFFIEKKPWRVNALNKLKIEFPHLTIRILPGDCNKIIVEDVLPVVRGRTKRSFIFMDPFGMDFEWSTIKEIARPKTIEILVNFPLMAVNRSSLPNNPYKLTDDNIERMNKLLGTTDWQDDIYAEEPDLFGQPSKCKIRQSADSLSNIFKRRLDTVFPFTSDPLIMTNSRGGPLYSLLFAGHNATGRKIMTHIFRKFDTKRF